MFEFTMDSNRCRFLVKCWWGPNQMPSENLNILHQQFHFYPNAVWYSRMCSYWEVHDLPGIKPYWWAESKFLLVKDSFYLWMGLTKKVLLPMTGSPTFSQIQSYMNALLDFNVRHNLSASAGYFFLALWRSVQAVWEYSWHHGRPVVSYVCSLVVLNIDLWYWFAIISECF